MNETYWTHLGILAAVITPVLAMWWDTRKHSAKMHMENQLKLTKIETKLEPLWRWWNSDSDRDRDGDD